MAERARALIIVDMQQAVLEDAAPDIAVLPERIAQHVRQQQPPYELVIATRFRNLPGSCYSRIKADDLRDGSEVTLCEQIEPIADVVIDSTTYSSATPDVINLLTGLESREVHLCGVDTDQCVLATTIALMDAGFHPTVHAGLCASASGRDPHEAGLLVLRRAIGEDRVLEP